MNTLIPLVKSDRSREMLVYKDKGYSFRTGENKYIYIRNIKIKVKRKTYFFQIRDNQSELKFYIYLNDSCIFLTLLEIYELLKQISDELGSNRVQKILVGDRKKIAVLDYMGLTFEVMFFSNTIPKGNVLLPESNLEISYEYLFLLIALIQDKSNYFWMLSKKDNRKYIDGIVRLFACLVSTKNNKFLKKLGWYYDANKEKYTFEELRDVNKIFTTKDNKGNVIRIKYYLTEKQFKDSIKNKKS